MKLMVILLPLKLRLESAGSVAVINGGRVSLGPPVGGMGWPQPVPDMTRMVVRARQNIIDANSFIVQTYSINVLPV